jgi:hypothetical protein
MTISFRVAAIVVLAFATITILDAQKKSSSTTKADASDADDSQIYRNATYGFRYQIQYGWVDRTKLMQEGSEAGKTEVLLAVFERPPESTGDTINSAVVIASESAKSYPGVRQVEDYASPLTELVLAKGFKPDGEPSGVDEEGRHLLRADFTKAINKKITMRQCTLVLLAKGQIVSFTFIAGSEGEIDELMDGLHFAGAKNPAH